MSIALVQSKVIFLGGGTTGSLAFDNPIGAGNALFAFAFDGGGINQTVTASDDINGAWGAANAHSNLATDHDTLAMLSFANSLAGSSGAHGTVTINGTNLDGFIIAEFSGLAASAIFDETSSGNSTGTAADSGNTGTTSQANELVLSMVGTANSGNTYSGAGSTTLLVQDQSAHIAAGYQIVSSAGAYKGQFGLVTTDEWGCLCCTYRGAGASGPPPSQFFMGATVGLGALGWMIDRRNRVPREEGARVRST